MKKLVLGCLVAFSALSFTVFAAQDGKEATDKKTECCCKDCACKDCTCRTDCSDCAGCSKKEGCADCKDCNHKGNCCDQEGERRGGCCGSGC